VYLMHEDGHCDRNMQHLLTGLINFVVVDGKHLSTSKTKLVNIRNPS